MAETKKVRALVLCSGGLDSTLAIKILEKQKIEVLALIFKSYFFSGKPAVKMAEEFNLPFRIFDFSEEHLKMVKNPKHGYGRAMNPCIDCHTLMLKKAGEIMLEEKFDFVATGEVLGERPMSQNLGALKVIEKQSGLYDYLLRPLSAKLLDPIAPERLKLINRDELLNISGRSRKRQMALAEELGIRNYPSPAGGCLLTDAIFGKRLEKIFEKDPDCGANDIELLKLGKHFWEEGSKIILGRNEEENKKLRDLTATGDILIELVDFNGPTAMIRSYQSGKIDNKAIERAKELTQYYSIKARGKKDLRFKEEFI